MECLWDQACVIFQLKHGEPHRTGPGPRSRWRFAYFTPDDIYEACLAKLVEPGMSWVDVGGGREIFPTNPRLAQMLAERCCELVALDPSDNIEENRFVHRRVKCCIEDYHEDHSYDLATLRMVAEHIGQPDQAVTALARLVKPGGKVVILTINRWTPVSLLSWIVPFGLHHRIKQLIWQTEEKDTFPVVYQMNTRCELASLFSQGGFRETAFFYLDDCRTFHRFPILNWLELVFWRALKAIGVRYPENCLLGIYERLPLGSTQARSEDSAAYAANGV